MVNTFETALPEDTLKDLLKWKTKEELLLLTKSPKVNDSNKLVINAILQNFENTAAQKADASEIYIWDEVKIKVGDEERIFRIGEKIWHIWAYEVYLKYWNPHIHDHVDQYFKEIFPRIKINGEDFIAHVEHMGEIIWYTSDVPTDENDKIIFAKRKDRPYYSRFVTTKQKLPENRITILLRKFDTNKYLIASARCWGYDWPVFEPTNAPTLEDYEKSVTHRSKNALVRGSEEIEKDTLITTDPSVFFFNKNFKTNESPEVLTPGNTILQQELEHNFPEFLEKWKNLLREIASRLIDPTEVRNLSFLENPDDPKEHSIPRHQYGIITHSIAFAQAIHDKKNWEYLKQQWIDLTLFMQENIDGLQKEQLLPLIGILHDVAKFIRNYTDDTLQSIWNHTGHEIKWAEIIANNQLIKKYLAWYDITPLQQQYIQNATAIHYELGKIRDALQRAKLPYTIASTETQAYKDQCHALAAQHPDLKTEIGLLPYFDKLATVETIVDGITTDEQIEKNQNTYITWLKERNLPEYLLAAAKQKPVNIMMAIHYLQTLE
jgi:hypothetical protein